MESYKYYAGLTSQVGFCATPLRLDPFNKCQYGCGYCYASTRQGFGRSQEFKVSAPESLAKRLKRVKEGKVSSALDELISKNVPFQLGGMSDPFMRMENKLSVTLSYLEILKEYNYPYIISTKSNLVAEPRYLEIVSNSNCYVRFSITVIDDKNRKLVDKGCPSVDKISAAAKVLAERGIPTSFRFQPIIPGFEYCFEQLLDIAVNSGVKHISAEYLKVPLDANVKFSRELKNVLGGNPIQFYKEHGAKKFGREYNLPLSYRGSHLAKMSREARQYGLTFGFADNDLLVHSDGKACCGASDLYLKDSNFFEANITWLAKRKNYGEKIFFSDYLEGWIPKKAISTYLNSKSRINIMDSDVPEWLHYLKAMWKGELGIYSPNYFDGIETTEDFDEQGLPIYVRAESNFEKIYSKKIANNTFNFEAQLSIPSVSIL
jgi:DNA repair photolyase